MNYIFEAFFFFFFLQLDHVIGPDCMVLFEQNRNEITLDIPPEGVVLKNGWSITPLGTTKVRLLASLLCLALLILFLFQILQHQFSFGQHVLCCELRVRWTKPEEHPVELCHRIKLLGAKPPGNFITLKIEPPSQPPLGMSSWYPSWEKQKCALNIRIIAECSKV